MDEDKNLQPLQPDESTEPELDENGTPIVDMTDADAADVAPEAAAGAISWPGAVVKNVPRWADETVPRASDGHMPATLGIQGVPRQSTLVKSMSPWAGNRTRTRSRRQHSAQRKPRLTTDAHPPRPPCPGGQPFDHVPPICARSLPRQRPL